MYQITYLEIAAAEYEDAILWYHSRSPDAAEKFVKAVNEKLDNISNNPYQYKSLYKKYHEVATGRYPYSIVYFIDDTQVSVVIVAIYHHKRHPKKKYRK